MTLLLSPNALKGSLSAFEAACVMQEAIERTAPELDTIVAPIADGGNGTLDCLAMALNADFRTATVRGPLGERRVKAKWGILETQKLAIIEMAEASGLHLLARDERDVLHASTYGVGELIKEAIDAGCTSITLGLGGSATNDGGAGCLRALGARFLDAQGAELTEGGAALIDLDRIDRSSIDPRLDSVAITILSDVTNPLLGPQGASHVFAPQKGATKDDVLTLERALTNYALVLKEQVGWDAAAVAGAGAAGGLAAGLLAFTGATIVSGIDYVLDIMEYDRMLAACDAVLTSEGMIDQQTEGGKGIAGVCRRAQLCGKPVHAFVGRIDGDARAIAENLGLASLRAISPADTPLEEAIARVRDYLAESVSAFIAQYRTDNNNDLIPGN